MKGDQPGESGARPAAPPADVADQVPVPAPFSLEEFRAGIEAWRGRPLALAEGRLVRDQPAAWIATAAADFIVYDRGLPPAGQVRAVARQLAHMLLGHQGSPDARHAAGELFPDLDPAVVTAELGAPASFTADEERDADAFAARLLTRIARTAPRGLPPDP